MDEYVVGVDAGGSSTSASAYDWLSGKLIGKGAAGYGNALVSYDKAMENIREAVSQAVSGLSGSCRLILVGAAGATAGGLNERMAEELGLAFGCRVNVETDACLALEGALEGGDGILLVAGTGSIAQGRNGDLLLTAGGWGNLIGDEGSGYDLVRRAVRLMTEDADWGRPEKPVCRMIREFFGASGARQVIGYLHGHVKADIAKASPLVEKAAAEGDPDASRILGEAGDALAGLVSCLAERLALPLQFRLALQGSVVRQVAPIRGRMLDILRRSGYEIILLPMETDLIRGAWHYAKALERASSELRGRREGKE